MIKPFSLRMHVARRVRIASAFGVLILFTAGFAPLNGAQSAMMGPQVPTLLLNDGPAAPVAQSAPKAPDATGLTLSSSAVTTSGDNAVVINGEAITYTFIITNLGPSIASNVKILDSIPPDTFDQINCLGALPCGRQIVSLFIPNPLGGFIEVTKTTLLTWTVASLALNDTATFSFRARVVGKSDGTVFTNNVFVSYDQGNPFQGQIITTTVRQKLLDNGNAGLPNAPTWFSTDSGGTLSQAWGDYDRDGVLDLALASSVGTTIYHNDKGVLRIAMSNQTQSYGVAWADVDGDGLLELIAVGDSTDKTAISTGVNYIYHYVPATGKFTLFSTFQSPLQFARIAAADLFGTGRMDLVASTNAINVQSLGKSAVYVYHNDGSGMFADINGWKAISNKATAAIGLGDFRNQGRPDVVLGQFPNGIVQLRNTSTLTSPTTPLTSGVSISFSVPIPIDNSISFLPYGFSVGDFDGDGYLDLAAAYPLQREARIYHNQGGGAFGISATIRTNVFWTPLSVDWGDFTGDGKASLLIADQPPKIVHFDAATNHFATVGQMVQGSVAGQVWDIRGVQTHPYQDQAVALTDRDQASMIFDGAAPHLARNLTTIDPRGNPEFAGSVALGDTTGSGRLDILFGSSGGNIGSRLYFNDGTSFPNFSSPNPSAVLGPEHVAVADISGNGSLQLAIGSAVDVRLYRVFDGSLQPQIISLPDGGPYTVAWGDVNGDGLLDLLVGSTGHIFAYLNIAGTVSTTPVWISTETCKTTSLAWADYDHSNWLSFAVGCDDAPARVYHNTTRNAFTLAWSAPYISHTSSVAWADYDASGYPSLALGNMGDHSVIYENNAGTMSPLPVWTSPTMSQTTSIAWGDWNNDGYPELALGNKNEPVQVFANLNSKPAQPRMAWIWSSHEASNVTGVAWGDVTNNGYQDLIVSSADAGGNGYYRNGTTLPSQFTNIYTPTLPLPIAPPNVTLRRPGRTLGAFLYSSAELLGGFRSPTVTVQYTIYGPDGTRNAQKDISTTVPISKVLFEYTLDGGANWLTATPDINSPLPVTRAARLGTPATFIWNPVADKAISDYAQFRVTAVKPDMAGPVHQAAGSAISPPFRVRATTCVWPASPVFFNTPLQPKVTDNVTFFGSIGFGSGQITYTWDFGDGSSPALGQNIVHSFTSPYTRTFNVNMTVTGQPCPITRPVFTTAQLLVGNPLAPKSRVFLPIVRSLASGLLAPVATGAVKQAQPTFQITDLTGDLDETKTGTQISWSHPSGTVTSYKVYRGTQGSPQPYELLATVSADTTVLDDTTAVCGRIYYITAVNGQSEESAPSTSSYYSLPCTR